jgi:hypothetical protein
MSRLFPDGTKLIHVESSIVDGHWKDKLVPCTYYYFQNDPRAHQVVFTDGRPTGGVRPGVYGYIDDDYDTQEIFLAFFDYRVAGSDINVLGNFPKKTDKEV